MARTVTTLRDRKYHALPNVTARNRKLAKDADVSLSTIQRIVDGDVGASVDTLYSLADTFNVRPQDLLTPFFGATNPADQERPELPKPSANQRRQSA